MRARAAWMLLRVTDSKIFLLGWVKKQKERKSEIGRKIKKPPAALAGGGLDAALPLSGSSGFVSRAHIGAANSHGGNRHGDAQDRRKARIGAGVMHHVDCSRAEKQGARQERLKARGARAVGHGSRFTRCAVTFKFSGV